MVAYRSLGSVSTYSNAGTEPAKMLGIIPPAGIEQFFEDIEGTSGPPRDGKDNGPCREIQRGDGGAAVRTISVAEPKAGWAGNSPIAQALGEDFHNLHAAVRKHYTEPTIDISGTMDAVHVNSTIKPLALVSYRLFHAPVPHSGQRSRI